MNFIIAHSFTDSLARLSGVEQKLAKTTAFELQVNPENPGFQFHKLDKAKDKDFWSVRASSDLRIIVHRSKESLLLCYVDHHDRAYAWAERRKIEVHPATGAAQVVELRETVKEIFIPVVKPGEPKKKEIQPLFWNLPEQELLSYGVPQEWIADAKAVDEDGLLKLADRLPSEAAEALLELATGGVPKVTKAGADSNPFKHPDAQRRFRVMENLEELERAFDFPWDQWTVFLHPEQRELVEKDWGGPARVSGSAGTGKTIVALHRAVHLARRHSDARILLATFSEPLANALRQMTRRLAGNEPRILERLDVHSLMALATRLHTSLIGAPKIASREEIEGLLRDGSQGPLQGRYSEAFIRIEWESIVDAWQLRTWESYQKAARPGKKVRLAESQRQILWKVFDQVWAKLGAQGKTTEAGIYSALEGKYRQTNQSPFDFAVVDECQDLSVPQLRFLAAMSGNRPNSLFFTGDLGQRIF